MMFALSRSLYTCASSPYGGGVTSVFCALMDNNQVKCWGQVGRLYLTIDEYTTLGNDPNEMGDNLASIDWGSGRSVLNMCVGELVA